MRNTIGYVLDLMSKIEGEEQSDNFLLQTSRNALREALTKPHRVCNTCNGTGVVNGLHNWAGGGKRSESCWNCHEEKQTEPDSIANITAAMVRKLREETDEPMMQCKLALYACNGNPEEAKEWLRVGRRLSHRI